MLPIPDISFAPPPPASSLPTRKFLKHLNNDDYILELDWSSSEPMLTCDRAAEYRLVHSRSTPAKAPLTYGAALHNALEHYYHERHEFGPAIAQMPTSIAAALQTAEAEFVKLPSDVGEWRTYDRLVETFTAYVRHYADEDFAVLDYGGAPMIERSFRCELGVIDVNTFLPYPRKLLVVDPPLDTAPHFRVGKLHIVWTGIIDLVISQAGQTRVVDHKTTSIAGDGFYDSFELSQQFIGYQWATEKLLGFQLDGALLNAIIGRKPTEKGKGKTLEFARRHYNYPRHRIDEWPLSIMAIIEDFVHHLTQGFFPVKTQWCQGKYGQCPFFKVCTAPPEHRQALLYSDLFTANTWNPLGGGAV